MATFAHSPPRKPATGATPDEPACRPAPAVRRRRPDGGRLRGLCAVAALAGAPVTLERRRCRYRGRGVTFNIEPAAIRMPVQRRPGTQERVDLAYLWPSLTPPDPALKPTVGAPVDPNERLFVTIASGDDTLPLIERVQTIYPRYLAPEPTAGPEGLTLRGFRDGRRTRARNWCSSRPRPSISWRAARCGRGQYRRMPA